MNTHYSGMRAPSRQRARSVQGLLLAILVVVILSMTPALAAPAGPTHYADTLGLAANGDGYTLTASSDGNGTVTPEPGGDSYEEGATVTLILTPAAGFTFSHWSGPDAADIVDTDGVYTLVMNADKSVTAHFVALICQETSLVTVADTQIFQDIPTYNYGRVSTVLVSARQHYVRHALFRWDVSSIPADATVSAASLRFWVTDPSIYQFQLYNMRREWVEGTRTSGGVQTGSVTWESSGPANWAIPGADDTDVDRYDTPLLIVDENTFKGADSQTIILNADGVEVVQGWVNNASSNHGALLRRLTSQGGSGETDFWTAYSRDHNDAAQRPTLIVTYCLPPAIATITVSGDLIPFSSTIGVPSAEQSYTVSGVNLTGALVITAPDGFEIAASEGGGFGSSLSLTPTGGTVSSTTIYVRLLRALPGTAGGNITHASTNATPVNRAVSGTVETRPPTDIALSDDEVAENEDIGTVVGAFTTTDPDAGDNHTYALVDDVAYPDNASFTIVDSELRTAVTFDFEAQNSYTILVRSTDAGGQFFEKEFTITITDVNEAPTADAGPDQTTEVNQPVTLDGSASSDPEEDDLTYAWTQIGVPAVTLSDATAVNPTFTAPAGRATLTFELTVSDGELASEADTVTITVLQPAIAISKQADVTNAEIGDTITYTYVITNTGDVTLTNVTAIDDMLGEVTLSATTLASLQSATGTLTYTVTEDDLPGPLVNVVTVTGTPPDGPDVTDNHQVSIDLTSQPAMEVSLTAAPEAVQPGQTVTYELTITNSGDVTLSELDSTASVPGGFTLPDSLAPGESVTVSYSYTVTADDLPGPLVNEVTVTATPTAGQPISATETVSTDLLEPEPEPFRLFLPLIIKP